nr:hypothetical protein [Tanacetum cinerariifolium]
MAKSSSISGGGGTRVSASKSFWSLAMYEMETRSCPLSFGGGIIIFGCVFCGGVVTVGDDCVSVSILVMVVVTLTVEVFRVTASSGMILCFMILYNLSCDLGAAEIGSLRIDSCIDLGGYMIAWMAGWKLMIVCWEVTSLVMLMLLLFEYGFGCHDQFYAEDNLVLYDGYEALVIILPEQIGTPLMLDSYTSDMCLHSWSMSSYVRAMIELCADVELEDTIMVPMPKLVREGFYTCTIRVENISENLLGVRVPTANTSGNKKKGVEPNKEVSNSNPFVVLNLVVNDVEFGTNGGTLNLACNGASSSGFSFWNVKTSITSTTPIVDKIRKLEKLIIYGKVTLVDDDGKTLKKVDYPGDHDSEDEDGDSDEDPYDDAMCEGQDFPDKIQDICDNLDIRVRGPRKK